MAESGIFKKMCRIHVRNRDCDVDCVHAQSLRMITQTDKKDAMTITRMLRLWKRYDIVLQIVYVLSREIYNYRR